MDGENGTAAPLDAADPRYGQASVPRHGQTSVPGSGPGRDPRGEPARRLVESKGPGPSPEQAAVRRLRVLIPLVFAGVVAGVIAVFTVGLAPGDGLQAVGPQAAVRAAVAARPHRVCYRGKQPCAWITLLDGELVAFTTNGPLAEETGRLGVAWCPSSGQYGSNVSGSRFDASGEVVSGPAPRGLDRVRLSTDAEGTLRIDFFALSTGTQAGRAEALVAPAGPVCDVIPFDRDADLDLGG